MLNITETIQKIAQRVGKALTSIVDSIVGRIGGWVARYKKLLEKHRQHEEYKEEIEKLECMYNPEQVDVELSKKLRAQMESLENGKLIEKIKSMSYESRNEYFEKTLFPLICNTMEITPGFLGWFESDHTAGVYREMEKGLALNKAFLWTDDENVLRLMINTIIHECKHARQCDAVYGRNSHGYSDELIATWKRNYDDYITPAESDELYMKQPIEWDADRFAESVWPIVNN